jgi:hypothetical protein
MKKIILLALAALMMVGCNMAMDSLDIVNGSKFIVISKAKEKQTYKYRLKEEGDSWYDYHYRDTTNFEVGDTLVITVGRVGN